MVSRCGVREGHKTPFFATNQNNNIDVCTTNNGRLVARYARTKGRHGDSSMLDFGMSVPPNGLFFCESPRR